MMRHPYILVILLIAGIPLVAFGDNRTVKNVTFNDGMIFTLKLIFNLTVPD